MSVNKDQIKEVLVEILGTDKKAKKAKTPFEARKPITAVFYNKSNGTLAHINDLNGPVGSFKSAAKAKDFFQGLDMPHKITMVLSTETSVIKTNLPLVETESK